MKKYLNYFFLGALALAYSSCDEAEEYQPSAEKRAFIAGAATRSVLEGCEPGTVDYTIQTSNADASGSVVFDLMGNAVYGTDYTVTGANVTGASADGFTVNLTPVEGMATGMFSITYPDDNVVDGTKQVIAKMVSANAGSELMLGNFAGGKDSIVVNIGDGAAVDYSGTYNVNTVSNACAAPISTTITLAKKTGTTNMYRLSDVTFGAYRLCYGASNNPADITITPEGVVTIVNQPDVVYGGDIFNGAGTAQPCGSFEVTWSNGYGDAGTSTATK